MVKLESTTMVSDSAHLRVIATKDTPHFQYLVKATHCCLNSIHRLFIDLLGHDESQVTIGDEAYALFDTFARCHDLRFCICSP